MTPVLAPTLSPPPTSIPSQAWLADLPFLAGGCIKYHGVASSRNLGGEIGGEIEMHTLDDTHVGEYVQCADRDTLAAAWEHSSDGGSHTRGSNPHPHAPSSSPLHPYHRGHVQLAAASGMHRRGGLLSRAYSSGAPPPAATRPARPAGPARRCRRRRRRTPHASVVPPATTALVEEGVHGATVEEP